MQQISPAINIEDPIINKKSEILIKTIWTVLAIITLSFASAMLIQSEFIPRYFLILSLIWPISIGLSILTKKGYVRLSAILYISFLILMIFGFSWFGGGIKGHGIKVLPIVVLFAGLMLGKKEIWLFGAIAVTGGLILVWADYLQLLPVTEAVGNSPLIYWLYTATGIFLLCYLENISVEKLRVALSNSQFELKMRKQTEELLYQKNEKLTKIAFLQTQSVRKPVTNVLQLINLMKLKKYDNEMNAELIEILETAATELDIILQQIVQTTSDIETVVNNDTNPKH